MRSAADCGGRQVNVVSPPYFVALKLEAFEERGDGDIVGSTDFEDVICLFNGKASIAEEIAADEHLAGVLGRKFAEYLAAPELEDAIDGSTAARSTATPLRAKARPSP